MFIQVIQGTTTDPDGLRAAVQRWADEIAPGSTGWLGSTSGTTADGRAIAVVRFESEELAQANGDRPQQQEWWEQTSRLFDGEVTFHNCTESFSFLAGGSDDAGFVQIIQGRVNDVDRMREMMARADDEIRTTRPDVIGGTVALHGDGGFTQVVYFSSEAAARAGEQSETQSESPARDEEMASVFGDATYFDLTEPLLQSPK